MLRHDKLRNRDVDSGWAWIVMVASYSGMLIYCIELYMAGVIYRALLDEYHEGAAKTSLVGAVSSGLLCIAAPFGGIIINKYSCRVAIVSGAFSTTIGFVLSAFVPSLNWMILTAGVLVGFGYAITSAGLICVLGFYFKRLRDPVISCAFLIVGVAMFISAPFGLHIIETYGLASAFIILASIHAQICVFGMLCKPSYIEHDVQTQKKILREDKSESASQSYIDLSLLKEKTFICFLLSTSAWNFALTVAVMHLPNYVSVLGGTNKDIGLLMTAFAVANIIGRLSGLIIVSKLNEKALHVHVIGLFITGIVTSTFTLYSESSAGTYIFTVQLGIFCGLPNSMMTPISISFVGVAKISEAYGLAYLFCGLGVSSGPVIIGYVFGTTGSYETSFLIAGVILLLGSLSGLLAVCKRKPISRDEWMDVHVDGEKHALQDIHKHDNNDVKEESASRVDIRDENYKIIIEYG